MRNRLTEALIDIGMIGDLADDVAAWLIESGWVTKEPQDGAKSAACNCARCWPKFYGFRVCETCGNKRCPANQWHGYKCTGSNEPGQEPERKEDVNS